MKMPCRVTNDLNEYLSGIAAHNAGFSQDKQDKKIKALAAVMAEDCILDIADEFTIEALLDLGSEWRDFAQHRLPQSSDEMNNQDFQRFGRAAHALLWSVQQKLIERNLDLAEDELS